MDLSPAKVSIPCMNNVADQSMETSKGSGRSAKNKGKGHRTELSVDERSGKKILSDKRHRLRKKMFFKNMTEEISQLKEYITEMQSQQKSSSQLLEKLGSYISQSTNQQHDDKGDSIQIIKQEMIAQLEHLQDIKKLTTENGELKEEIVRLSSVNGLLKLENERVSSENGFLKVETERLSTENKHLKEETSWRNFENKRLEDLIKGLRGKGQLLEVLQRQDSRISLPTCQDNHGMECNNDDHVYSNNRCVEKFGNEGAVAGMELESFTSKNSFFKSEFGRLTDEIKRLQEDITWLRPNWQFPAQDLNKLGDLFFQSTSQPHDDKSGSVQSTGFQLREGIQDVQKTGSSDEAAATNQNHTNNYS
ncbi:uncharacterized protein LOC120155460 [Hibiscus syriacus]|uniref:uncharacterized protein LOC120155460 n=1 Tax=Hibiscus syriacus TaxID=106335 RepID=UPI0019209C91|nr:uncharacterized protein LOC120155460 [Hibiscus syriacus]